MLTSARGFALFPAATLAALFLLAASPALEPGSPAPSPTASLMAVSIAEVDIAPDPVQAGKPVTITIRTSSNVVTVTGRALSHNFSIPKTADGIFSGSGNVPWWARFVHGSVKMTFVASDGNGATAQMEQTIRM